MTSTKILVTSLSLLGAFIATGCNNTQTSGTSGSGGSKTPTAGATAVHGDLMPTRLTQLVLPKPAPMEGLRGANALAPNKPFTFESPALPTVGRDFHRSIGGTDTASLTFPVDTPRGAMVLVRTMDRTPISSLHMHSIATGARLDHARDADNSQGVQRGGLREPAFTPLLDSRQLSFDEAFAPGLVGLDLPRDTLSHGVILEVQEPNSRITLSAVPDELAHTDGETVAFNFSIADGETPVDGATFHATAIYPNNTRSPEFTVRSLGSGQYTARVPLSGSDNVGTWGIHVSASGTSNGVAFERDVDTAFQYTVSHAQMTAIGSPVITRGGDGKIDDISFDIDVHSLADDDFSARGTLTYTGGDGAEHALASARTGQMITGGTGTITLHFTADAVALAQVAGPFHLRDVALVSEGNQLTQHRIGRGLDLVTAAFGAEEVRYPQTISLQAQDLIENGDLPSARTHQ
jgi:hypothetical protein